jgi:uncharacterized protein
VTHPDPNRAITYALTRLEYELAPGFVYHSVAHTRDEVLPAVAYLAEHEAVTGEYVLLLHTAAAYHDIGFVRGPDDHEARGVAIARDVLPRFGYTPDQVDMVARLILSTRMPPQPQTLLQRILIDADLDSLGRLDFLGRSHDLRAERAAHGEEIPLTTWYQQQLHFLRAHCYFTAAARVRRNDGKRCNIELLKSLIAMTGHPAKQGGADIW